MGQSFFAGKLRPNFPFRWFCARARNQQRTGSDYETPKKAKHFGVESMLGRDQTDNVQNPLKIVVAIIFDFDPSPFRGVMNRHVGAEMLTQFVLQIPDRRRAYDYFGTSAPFLPPPKET